MSKVSVEQLCEFFRQIAEGLITGASVQEVIERGNELALSQIKKRMVDQVWFEARVLADPNRRAAAMWYVAAASQDFEALSEICGLIEKMENPDVNFTAMACLLDNPDFKLWCARQALRITDPYQRALRLVELAPGYFGVNPDAGDLMDKAQEDIRKIDEEEKQNIVRTAISTAYAKKQRFLLARREADEINMPYFRAMAYVGIFRLSRKENDLKQAMLSLGFVNDFWGDSIRKELVNVHSEHGDFGKAWEMVHKIDTKDFIPDALLAIVKSAVESGNERSMSKAMHMLLLDEYRWWRTRGHLLVAAGWKVSKDYPEKIRRSVGLCQDAGHRAEALAELAAITRDPKDIEAAHGELKSITDPAEKFKTLLAVIKAFK